MVSVDGCFGPPPQQRGLSSRKLDLCEIQMNPSIERFCRPLGCVRRTRRGSFAPSINYFLQKLPVIAQLDRGSPRRTPGCQLRAQAVHKKIALYFGRLSLAKEISARNSQRYGFVANLRLQDRLADRVETGFRGLLELAPRQCVLRLLFAGERALHLLQIA